VEIKSASDTGRGDDAMYVVGVLKTLYFGCRVSGLDELNLIELTVNA